jgi:hypothetical protein
LLHLHSSCLMILGTLLKTDFNILSHDGVTVDGVWIGNWTH